VREYGAVVIGDARDTGVLEGAGVRSASHLVVVCGDDGVNADIAARAGDVMADQHRHVLTCHVHVADPALWAQLRVRDTASRATPVRLHLFSVVDAAAEALVPVALASIQAQAPESPHLLMVGVDPVGEHVIARAARSWSTAPGRVGERLRITVVDERASAAAARLSARYPRLADVCTLVPLDVDVRSPAFERGDALAAIGPGVGAACVTTGEDAAAMAVGMALVHASPRERYPVYVCTTHERGLGLLLTDAVETPEAGRLRIFGTFERGCSPDLLLRGTNELLARAIHDEYIRNQASRGQTVGTNPAMRPWEQLSDVLRESNRRQADHIGAKLDAVGCGVGPMRDWDAPLVTFTKDEVERMGRMEHARWVEERMADGWHFDPGPKDEAGKTSPYLVEWEVLKDEVRDFDRNTVREMPMFLARAGFVVYRRGAAPSGSGSEAG